MNLADRLPNREDAFRVYAVIIVLFYSWTIITTLKDLSSNWLFYLNLADIVALFAYSFVGAFLESLISIIALLLLGFIFPRKWFSENFVLYGSILSLALAGSLVYLYSQTLSYGILDKAGLWTVAFLGTVTVLILLSKIFPFIDVVIQSMAERFVVFLYIYLPISAISILIVILRNIN